MNTLRNLNASTAGEKAEAAALREAMVAELRKLEVIRSDAVARAVGAVPRHVFAPGEPLERCYAAKTILQTKRDERGVPISMISAADIQAMMLEQAQLVPGMRVLEIGSGGYNAALIAELVGDTGQVTTVDIDAEVIDRTRRCLDAAGYDRVHAVVADAADGVPAHAPYDCIIATTSAWDVPPAWTDQLAEGGRLVVPLRMRGMTRSVVFERDGNRLVSTGYELCSFVPMQGVASPEEQRISLDRDQVGLRLDADQPVDVERLREALFQPSLEAWSSVTASGTGRFVGMRSGAGDQGGEPLVDADGVGKALVVGDPHRPVAAIAEVFGVQALFTGQHGGAGGSEDVVHGCGAQDDRGLKAVDH